MKQKEILSSIPHEIDEEQVDAFDLDHFSTSTDTPMRDYAFELSD